MRLSGVIVISWCATLLCAEANYPAIWSLSPKERQALLASRVRYLEQSGTASARLVERVQSASSGEQQDQTAAVRQAAIAAVDAQQQNANAKQNAFSASMQAGAATAKASIDQTNLTRQAEIVLDSVQKWQPPRTSQAASANHPDLVDPFAPTTDAKVPDAPSPARALEHSLGGTCLDFDSKRMLGRVGPTCSWPSIKSKPQAGDYPVLEDGTLLDTESKVVQFMKLVRHPEQHIYVLRSESELVQIR